MGPVSALLLKLTVCRNVHPPRKGSSSPERPAFGALSTVRLFIL